MTAQAVARGTAETFRPALSNRLLNTVMACMPMRGSIPDVAAMVETAAASAATSVPDKAWFEDGLRALVDCFRQAPRTTYLTRKRFAIICHAHLVNCLRVQAYLAKCSAELEQIGTNRPIFVLGLPRTGTTLLHKLLSLDDKAKPLLYWEQMNPVPSPEPSTYESDPRIGAAEARVARIEKTAPMLAKIHAIDPRGPEECNGLFEMQFCWPTFAGAYDVPNYRDWVLNQDMTVAYRRYKNILGGLGRHFPDSRWVLKAPMHLNFLDALLTVFPDAIVIQNHRDPLSVIPSAASLSLIYRGVASDYAEAASIGRLTVQRWAASMHRAMDVRHGLAENRVFDVAFSSLASDPVATVRRIYETYNLTYTDAFDECMQTWLKDNRRHKHGVHRYSLEQFKLAPEDIQHQFSRYYDTYGEWLA